MIYSAVSPDVPIDQGDIIDGYPVLSIQDFDLRSPDKPKVHCDLVRGYVLTGVNGDSMHVVEVSLGVLFHF